MPVIFSGHSGRISIADTLLIAIVVTATVVLWPSQSSVAANGTVSYGYDAVGRVISATYDTCLSVNYSYDLNGNRLSESTQAVGGGATGVWGCFNWNGKNWGSSY